MSESFEPRRVIGQAIDSAYGALDLLASVIPPPRPEYERSFGEMVAGYFKRRNPRPPAEQMRKTANQLDRLAVDVQTVLEALRDAELEQLAGDLDGLGDALWRGHADPKKARSIVVAIDRRLTQLTPPHET